MRLPVRTITRPPISSRRIRFGEPTSSRPSGVIVAAFSPKPSSRIARAASWTTAFCVSRRASSERSKRGNSSSNPMTSGARTRSDSSSSSSPVSSPSSTTIVLFCTVADTSGRRCRGRGVGGAWGRGRFRYVDARDSTGMERRLDLAEPRRKVEATGVDAAGRRQRCAGRSSTTSSPGQVNELLALPGGRRLFRYIWDDGPCNLTGARLNDYVREYLGEEFTAKDFRTWGGTLLAAIAFAEHGAPESEREAKK